MKMEIVSGEERHGACDFGSRQKIPSGTKGDVCVDPYDLCMSHPVIEHKPGTEVEIGGRTYVFVDPLRDCARCGHYSAR